MQKIASYSADAAAAAATTALGVLTATSIRYNSVFDVSQEKVLSQQSKRVPGSLV